MAKVYRKIWNLVQGKLMQWCEHPINTSEGITSVNEVTEKISQEAFFGRPVKILNSKNFPIPDVEGTRGTHIKLHCTYYYCRWKILTNIKDY